MFPAQQLFSISLSDSPPVIVNNNEIEEEENNDEFIEPKNEENNIDIYETTQFNELQKLLLYLPDIGNEELEKNLLLREDSIHPKYGEVLEEVFPPVEKFMPPLPSRSADMLQEGNIGEFEDEDESEQKVLIKEEVVETTREQLKVTAWQPHQNEKTFQQQIYQIHVTNILITFSHQMIPLQSLEDSEHRQLPITINPHVEGKWRWVNVREIGFSPRDERLPGANSYTVEIGKCNAEDPSVLPLENFSFSFRSPSPSVTEIRPNYTSLKHETEPMFVIYFNMKISEVTAQFISVSKSTLLLFESGLNFRLLARDNEEVVRFLGHPLEETGLAIQCDRIPFNTTYYVNVKNAISTEGPFQMLPSFKHKSKFATPSFFTLNGTKKFSVFKTDQKEQYFIFNLYFTSQLHPSITNETINEYLKIKSNSTNSQIKFDNPGTAHVRVRFPENFGRVVFEVSRTLKDIYDQNLTGSNTITIDFKPPQATYVDNSQYLGYSRQSCSNILRGHQFFQLKTEQKSYSFYCKNFNELRVTVYRVDWTLFASYNSDFIENWYPSNRGIVDLIAKKYKDNAVFDKVLPINDPLFTKDQSVQCEYYFDYSQLIGDFGNLLILIQPTENSINKPLSSWFSNRYWEERAHVHSWIIDTNLAPIVRRLNQKYFVAVFSLTTNEPLAGIEVRDDINGLHGITNAEGYLLFDSPVHPRYMYLVSPENGDSTLINIDALIGAATPQIGNKLLFYVLDDRKLYKPKEEIHIKGFIRELIFIKEEPSKLIVPDYHEITFTIKDSRNCVLINEEKAQLVTGAFEFAYVLPDNINLGSQTITIACEGQVFNHYFKVQEFSTPEYEVTSSIISKGSYYPLINDNNLYGFDQEIIDFLSSQQHLQPISFDSTDIQMKIKKFLDNISSYPTISSAKNNNFAQAEVLAKYYSGGALSDSKVYWTVSFTLDHFRSPIWSEYSFASSSDHHTTFVPQVPGLPQMIEDCLDSYSTQNLVHSNKTNAEGKSHLYLHFDGVLFSCHQANVSIQSTVVDINQKQLVSNTQLSVYSSELQVGMKVNLPERTVSFIVINPSYPEQLVGNVPIYVHCSVLNQNSASTFILLSSSEEETTFSYDVFDYDFNYYVNIYAFVRDRYARFSSCHKKSILSSRYNIPAPVNSNPEHFFTPKSVYEVGEEVVITVTSPIIPSSVVFSKMVDHNIETKVFYIQDEQRILDYRFIVKESDIPNFTVFVNIYDVSHSQSYSKSMHFTVSKGSKRLLVEVNPDQSNTSPGAEIEVDVHVKRIDGQPLDEECDVLLFIVDESVLKSAAYSISDPLTSFYVSKFAYQMEATNFRYYQLLASIANLANQNKELDDVRGLMLRNIDNILLRGDNISMLETNCADVQLQSAQFYSKSKKMSSPFGGLFSGARRRVQNYESERGGGAYEEVRSSNLAPPPSPLVERKDFNPLVMFESKRTSDGRVTFKTTMRDSITRYQVYALAATDLCFGYGENKITVSLPITIRQSPPRFLNFGDKDVSISVVLTNQLSIEVNLTVLMKSCNFLLSTLSGAIRFKTEVEVDDDGFVDKTYYALGYNVTLPPHGRKIIKFKGDTIKAGKAKFQVLLHWNSFNDLVKFEVPVYTPLTGESFAAYGSSADTSQFVTIPVKVPENIHPLFGGLSIKASTTILNNLSDAYGYLHNYLFECNEQIASKVIPMILMKDFVQQLFYKSTDKLDSVVSEKLALLSKRQCSNGGFGFWSYNDKQTSPYVSCHVGMLFGLADRENYTINQEIYDNLLQYLRKITRFTFVIPFVSLFTNWLIFSFSLYARYLMGDDILSLVDKALKFYQKFDEKLTSLSLEIVSWIGVIFSEALLDSRLTEKKHNSIMSAIEKIIAFFEIKIVSQGDHAHFVCNVSDQDQYISLHSNNRTDSIVLYALLHLDPNHEIVPKLVKSVLAQRQNGHWRNTQENCFALLALNKYFKTYEGTEPNFETRVWFDGKFAGDLNFSGRSIDSKQISIPMNYLVESKEKERALFQFQKEGDGRLYYRVALSYAPDDLNFNNVERGFTISRNYVPFKQGELEYSQNGEVICQLGAKIKITLTIRSQTVNYNVALIDYIPAGFEVINTTIAGFSEAEDRVSNYNWDHINYRNERVEASANLTSPGEKKFSYVVRATTCGTFRTPPAKIEEMYTPELFGRTGSEIVIIQ